MRNLASPEWMIDEFLGRVHLDLKTTSVWARLVTRSSLKCLFQRERLSIWPLEERESTRAQRRKSSWRVTYRPRYPRATPFWILTQDLDSWQCQNFAIVKVSSSLAKLLSKLLWTSPCGTRFRRSTFGWDNLCPNWLLYVHTFALPRLRNGYLCLFRSDQPYLSFLFLKLPRSKLRTGKVGQTWSFIFPAGWQRSDHSVDYIWPHGWQCYRFHNSGSYEANEHAFSCM